MAARCITRSCSRLTASNPSSAAQAYLQLSPRRFLNSSPLQVFDFLLPSFPSKAIRNGRGSKSSSSRITAQSSRVFTSSCVRGQTSAIVNPRKDDDGNDMTVEITPRASNRLKEIMSKDSNPNLALRIQVESGGCHGFQYLMSLTTLPPLDSSSYLTDDAIPTLHTSSSDLNANPLKSPPSPVSSEMKLKLGKLDEDDTVFAADDGSGAKVVMDVSSLELLKGSRIDFTMELIGSQFKIVDNPRASSSCGCGTSFDMKA